MKRRGPNDAPLYEKKEKGNASLVARLSIYAYMDKKKAWTYGCWSAISLLPLISYNGSKNMMHIKGNVKMNINCKQW